MVADGLTSRIVPPPIIPSIVAGIYEAVSIAIASTFWVGILAAISAAALALFLREVPNAGDVRDGPEVQAA